MRLNKTIYIVPTIIAAMIIMVATGCSTHKNTAATRRWHAFKARYNTYYNGTLAYIDASEEKENGNKDNFTELLPLYTVGNKQSRELGKAGYDRAIEKSQKTIKQHSIKRRPVWDKKRRKTERDREWLARREYNPFLWRAWLLMGRSQFHKGAFDEAASTFAYMSRLYRTQPAIYGKARAWLAKCYIEEGWMYDAEDVIRGIKRDSIHWAAQKEWDYTLADYYLHTADYAKAATYLRRVIRHEMRRKQRAREWFLMGQIQTLMGDNAAATQAYKRVIRLNPPYEIEFNARIAMTEVMSGQQSKQMIARLKRMAASDKNKDYLDQVYYAIGNIYMARKDTAAAITAYERGAAKATRTGIEKGVLLLHLGNIYWDMERYGDAQRCYGEAIGMLDKDRKDYEQLTERSKVLDELVPYTDALHLQDSLQQLAAMDEAARNAAIDRTIDALKRKEKEERRLKAEQEAQQSISQNGGLGQNTTRSSRPTNSTQGNKTSTAGNALWYFYNPTAVSQGKTTFQQQWGRRENVDNWQRINKTVVASNDDTQANDTIGDTQPDAATAAATAANDSAANDPHRREYYMAQIPFTPEQKAASDKIIEDALYNAGVIFKDKLDNLPLAEKQLTRLADNYADYERMADVYYHLFLLYMRKNQAATANTYIAKLKKGYPDNEWTTLLSDPNYIENARYGTHREDSLYAATYDAFNEARYAEAEANATLSANRYPLGANRAKFMFIGGLAKLNNGNADGCLADMKAVVEKYPESDVATMAGMIVKGVQDGRRLHGGKFDISDVWQRRTETLADSATTTQRQLSDERNTPFTYMSVYNPDSVDENRMLFLLAKYNFTSYLVRNFDIQIEGIDGAHRIKVSGFRNYDEALLYARNLHKQTDVARLLARGRTVIVSDENLPLIGQLYSYDDYAAFYNRHFAPLKVDDENLLYEPEYEIPTAPDSHNDKQHDDWLDDDAPNGGNRQGSTNIVLDGETPAATQEKNGNETILDIEGPKTQPKVEPKTQPKVKQEVTPKVEPKPLPKADPKTTPKVEPKPQPKVEPKKNTEDEFYFSNDTAPSQQKEKDKKKDDGYNDDEYYDLDGF